MFASYRLLSRNTVILAASIGAVLTAFFAWYPLLPLHLRALGASDAQVGIWFTIFALAHTLPNFAAGLLADRVGRKWVALGPGILLSPLYIVGGLTHDWLTLSFILVFTNALGALQWAPMQALIAESDELQRANAFSLIEVFVLSASVIGPAASSLLLPWFGVSGFMIAHGLILIPTTIVRAYGLHETHHAHHRQSIREINWRTMISPTAWWIISANALFALALGLSITGPFVAILAHDVWRLGDQEFQVMNTLASGAAFGGIWLGSKADRWGSRRVWIVAALGMSLALVGWGLAPNVLLGMPFVLTAYLCNEALFIIGETLIAQHTARATRSFIFGLTGTLSGLAGVPGPAAGAWLVNLTRLAATFIAAAVVSLLSVATVLPVEDVVTDEATARSAAE